MCRHRRHLKGSLKPPCFDRDTPIVTAVTQQGSAALATDFGQNVVGSTADPSTFGRSKDIILWKDGLLKIGI
ncbi:unnamed protein product [Callosobruchus maculatus]|uniref:Uncharacterized protein n=1 Tax=Callosobruchus maculatus TaxID=64391 RepID=A0A653DEU4_CALMS|nr:unnamed protein product [Callosobruchus maculatus]